jgi:hypothetical protein
MRFVKRLLIGIGVVTLVGALLTLVGPKAVHAAVNALVQVNNTAAAPALTLDVSKSASQHIELFCSTNPISEASSCATAANPSTPYVVPAGQNLMVTSIDITCAVSKCTFELQVPGPALTSGFRIWFMPDVSVTHSFIYPSGIQYPAGFTFGGLNVGANGGGANLYGFLTSS